jgi:hypothetical protein
MVNSDYYQYLAPLVQFFNNFLTAPEVLNIGNIAINLFC